MQLCFLSNLTSTEWAAWVQAIGSLLALAVAIGVPMRMRHTERKQRQEDDKARAHIVAAAVQLMMSPIIGCLNTIASQMRSHQPGFTSLDAKMVYETLNNPNVPDQEQMLVIGLANRDIAVALARGTNHLAQMRKAISLLLGRTDTHSVAGQIAALLPLAEYCLAQFEHAAAGLEAFVNQMEGVEEGKS